MPTELCALLYEVLKTAGVPVVGVSIGIATDRSTWRVDYAPTATDADKVLGASTVANFNETASSVVTADRTRRRNQNLWSPQVTAVVKALHDRLRSAGVDQMQMGAFRAMVETEYDALVN